MIGRVIGRDGARVSVMLYRDGRQWLDVTVPADDVVVWVPRTMSRSLIRAFAAAELPRHHPGQPSMIGSCDLPTPLPDVRRVPSWLALLARSDVANDVEVTLRAERPVVATEAIPVERVRLGTETVRDEETVSGEVHEEQIELDDDSRTGPRDNRR